MKSFFTKLGKMLLCGVAVAVVGCTDYDTDIQNVNERVDAVEADLEQALADLGSKVQANAAAITALEATLNSKIAEEVKNLNAAIDRKADKTTVDQQFEALNATLAEAKTALEAAIKTNADAIEGAVARITALETAGKALQEAVAKNAEDIAALQADLKAQVEALKAYIDTAVEEIYTAIEVVQEFASAINTLLKEEVARLDIEDAAIWEKIDTIEEVCTNLDNLIKLEAQERKDADDLIYQEIETLRQSISSVYTTLNEKIDTEVAELNNTIAQLTQTVATVYTYVTELEAALNAHVAAFNAYKETNDARVAEAEAAIEALQGEIDLVNKAIETVNQTISAVLASHADDIAALRADLQAAVEGLNATIETTQEALTVVIRNLEGLSADVEALLARVQSLVYVPEYSDHKATIYYAEINKSKTYVGIQSIIRYRVNAKADESAAQAAADLAAAWKTNPSILSFELEQVATRAAEASLKIAKVEANGEDLYVYAVAKNFDSKFFESKKNMYSAALVLTDGNNNISSAYTNLTAGNKTNITAVVIDAEGNEITDKTASAELLPYDGQDPAEVTVLKGHRLGFKINYDKSAYLTIDEMLAAGFDINVVRSVYTTDNLSHNTHSAIDSKPGVIREVGSFCIEERPFVNNNVESDTHVKVKGTVSKDQYKALKEKGNNVLTLDFNYNVNGVVVKTTGLVEMCNRLVTVDLGAVQIPWTLKLASDLYGTKPYENAVPYKGFAYDLNKAANKSLEGYSLDAILHTGTPVKTHGGNYDIQMSINEKTVDFSLAGDYEFPAYDAENEKWNTYTVQWVNDFDDLTITVRAAIKLGERPAPFVVNDNTLKFKITEGVDGWVYANSAIVEPMFKQYRSLIGIEDDAVAKKFFGEVLARTTVTANAINGKKNELLDPSNIDTPISSFDSIKLGIHASQIIEGTQTLNVEQTDANTGALFQFNFAGSVVLPKDVLAYSTVDYVNYDATQERWEVEVDGDIVNNKYTIDQADLGKYFYVNDEVEYGVNRKLQVKFAINTNNAPAPVDTNIVGVYKDATSLINVLEADKSVIKDWTNGGKFGENEIKVTATLLANGFPVDVKTVVLFTKDPLEFTTTSDIEVERVPGKDAIAYTHRVLSLTETIHDGIGGNLINTEGYPSQLFANSHADTIYGAKFINQNEDTPTWNCRLVRVYTEKDGEKVTYPGQKYTFNNGKVTLIADDGLLNQPIYAEVEYVLTHDYNYGQDEKVTVKVTFVPNNNL